MNRLAQLQQLSARLDKTLTQFGLTANAEGEYPWQTAQREKRNRRMASAAVGAAAIGAGSYGAKKLHGAMNARYGTQGMDGIKAGAADLVNRADDVVKAGAAKVKGYAGQAGQQVKVGAKRVGTYGKNVAGAYQQARKGAMVMGKATGGKGILGAGLQALRKVRFDRADDLTEFTGDFTVRQPGSWANGKQIGTQVRRPAMPNLEAIRKRAKLNVRQMVGTKLKPMAFRGIKFDRADQIIALEAKLDGVLNEFARDVGGGYSRLREEREYDPETSTVRKRLALEKKPGVKEHLKRNAASYVGAAGGLAGGGYAAKKISGMLKGKRLGGITLGGLSPRGKFYTAALAGSIGHGAGDKIDKGRANARIYEKLVREGKIDAVKIDKSMEDPRSDWPKAVVDSDREMFKSQPKSKR